MGGLRLTVLGSGVAWANPGGVCSGYLVQADDATILIDCGTGTLGRLRTHVEPKWLDTVLISHMHADHFLDLVGLRYGMLYGGFAGDRPLRVMLPPGGCARLEQLGLALDNDAGFFSDVFALSEYAPDDAVAVGSVTITFRLVQHYISAYAVRLEAGRTLAYSGDSAPCDALVEHARGADTLLCEAALQHRGQDEADARKRGHLTAAEAGGIAQQAGVGRLLLTHAPLELDDLGRAAREARTTYRGPVERVVDGKTYDV